MTKEWVDNYAKREKEELLDRGEKFISEFFAKNKNLLSEDDCNDLKAIYKDTVDRAISGKYFYISFIDCMRVYRKRHGVRPSEELIDLFSDFTSGIEVKVLSHGGAVGKDFYNRYIDSEPVDFDGDIMITDPCYIVSEKIDGGREKWGNFRCGDDMSAWGITPSMSRDTIYGDWSCSVYDSNTKECIGGFCADAGMVAVVDYQSALKYNREEVLALADKGWVATVIKNFKGSVKFVVNYTSGEYEDDSKYHNKGDIWEDFSVSVVGHGVDKVTGNAIDFFSSQSGF